MTLVPMTVIPGFRLSSLVVFCSAWLAAAGTARAQLESPAQRIQELEARQGVLEKRIADLEEDLADVSSGDFLATGLDLGGAEFFLDGKIEFNLIDAQFDRFGPVAVDGVTDEPDFHAELQRFRLQPRIVLNEWVEIRAQLDFEPQEGDTNLREAVVRHEWEHEWWLESRAQIGLDDRFMRPDRRTKSYPLIGNAFWRRESIALTWRLSFGDNNGRPLGAPTFAETDTGTEGFDASVGGGPTDIEPFDFLNNYGRVRAYFSIGQGYELNNNEVSFDGAAFNDIVLDDRELNDDLAFRELGFGLGYDRNFGRYGEVGVLGFYYDDELRDGSLLYLQEELTLRDPGGAPVAGYGDSQSRESYRYGGTVEYFLPASSVYGAVLETRRNDGLRVLAQFIRGVDGDFERAGWFSQASWRVSFGRLLFDRWFRSVEPFVRYGELMVNVPSHPSLPGTWDRRKLTVGAFVEVTSEIFVKVEYDFNSETTGGSRTGLGPDSVDNDELLIHLLFRF